MELSEEEHWVDLHRSVVCGQGAEMEGVGSEY